MENIRVFLLFFLSENLVVKCSVYLNRLVFVMISKLLLVVITKLLSSKTVIN